eukprot:5965640-Prymnesium_polylepis.1
MAFAQSHSAFTAARGTATGFSADYPNPSWAARAGYSQYQTTGVWFDPAAAEPTPRIFQMT